MAHYTHTKHDILNKAIRLIANDGYENVTLSSIASSVGIKAASVYNHYASKEAILQSIYDYYLAHCFDTRLTPEEYEPILRTGTSEDIMGVFNYPLSDDPEEGARMFNIVRIIWTRAFFDAKAQEIYRRCNIEEGLRYVTGVITRGIEIGRVLMPREKVQSFAMTVLACRLFSASAVVTDPDREKWRDTETMMLHTISSLLALSPPLPL